MRLGATCYKLQASYSMQDRFGNNPAFGLDINSAAGIRCHGHLGPPYI